MKRTISIAILSAALVACGGGEKGGQSVSDVIGTGDLTTIKAKKTELSKKQSELLAEIKTLEAEIDKLDTSKKVDLVSVEQLKMQSFHHYLETQGSVQTKQNVLIYPETGGLLEQVYVKEGQRVSKGQLLAKIDDGGLSQQVSQLEIQRDLAKTTFERQAKLWKQKIGSEIQYLQTKANYEAQEKAIAQLNETLAKSRITAPFSGVIDNVIKEEGNIIAPGPGSEIFRIVNLGNMYIEAEIPESHLKNVSKGKDVIIDFPVLGTKVNSKIRQVGNFINPGNRSFKVEIGVGNKDGNIKPNLTARLKINDYTNDNAILIPQSIISEDSEGRQYVYTADTKGGKTVAVKAFVETGLTSSDNIEILKGLKEGDSIIVDGARTVKNNQEVKIIK
ncbi:MAG: efflux RND transporter periplasmic adaptor subunit [Flavobacteriales bacterium]